MLCVRVLHVAFTTSPRRKPTFARPSGVVSSRMGSSPHGNSVVPPDDQSEGVHSKAVSVDDQSEGVHSKAVSVDDVSGWIGIMSVLLGVRHRM